MENWYCASRHIVHYKSRGHDKCKILLQMAKNALVSAPREHQNSNITINSFLIALLELQAKFFAFSRICTLREAEENGLV